jgi:hypothetical protein
VGMTEKIAITKTPIVTTNDRLIPASENVW